MVVELNLGSVDQSRQYFEDIAQSSFGDTGVSAVEVYRDSVLGKGYQEAANIASLALSSLDRGDRGNGGLPRLKELSQQGQTIPLAMASGDAQLRVEEMLTLAESGEDDSIFLKRDWVAASLDVLTTYQVIHGHLRESQLKLWEK